MLRTILFAIALTVAAITTARAGDAPKATLYKNPQCGCCEEYASYLRGNGFDVAVTPTYDLETINRKAGVPE